MHSCLTCDKACMGLWELAVDDGMCAAVATVCFLDLRHPPISQAHFLLSSPSANTCPPSFAAPPPPGAWSAIKLRGSNLTISNETPYHASPQVEAMYQVKAGAVVDVNKCSQCINMCITLRQLSNVHALLFSGLVCDCHGAALNWLLLFRTLTGRQLFLPFLT